ncbi:MAG: peptidylprolyl isomerase SurA [Gammaproteobacteria bacterium]|jgi:peptidyl-prolyl cis-trans isomerase SurA|nr:peptidylprolyl isomerase SurA [Gammaproteobacteria bacterium]
MANKLPKYLIACAILTFSTVSFATNTPTDSNKIAAVVNDQVITQSELNQMINAINDQQKASNTKPSSASNVCKDAMDQLIARDIQLQLAKNANITVSDEELKAALAQIASEHQLAPNQLESTLTQQGINYKQYLKQITDQLTIQKLQQRQLASTIVITPQEIDKLAKKLKAEKKDTTQVFYHFMGILIPLPAAPTPADLTKAKQTFDTIAADLNKNQDFSSISQEAVDTAPQDLGWRSADQLPPGFLPIASKLTVGQVAQPVRTANGIFILKLIDKKTAPAPSSINTAITETHVEHILIKNDPLAPEATLKRRILSIRDAIVKGGEDFAKAAEENSQDPGSAPKGGDLGWAKPETLDSSFEGAMNKLKIGEISEPVKSQYGWHLIKVLGRRQANDADTAWKLKAQQILFQQKMDSAVKQMISQLRAQAYIKIFDQACH